MSIFGDKATFAFEIEPLTGPPPEDDPSAAATWARLQLWLHNDNLSRHVHTDEGRVEAGLHWPVIHLVRWLVRSWPKLFNEQQWPLPGWYRNARDVCNALDRKLLEIEEAVDRGQSNEADAETFAAYRDSLVGTHAMAAAAAGGLIPDLYLARDGDRVSIAMGVGKSHPSTWFQFEKGERDVPTTLFVDAARGLVQWTLEMVSTIEHAVCAQDRRELGEWLRALDSDEAAEDALSGYTGVSSADLTAILTVAHEPVSTSAAAPASINAAVDAFFELEPGWRRAGARFDPSRSGVAMVFRALSPTLDLSDVLEILDVLKECPRDDRARAWLTGLQAKLPSPTAHELDYEQGYYLAEQVRKHLGNPDGHLDVEELLRAHHIGIEQLEIPDPDIDGGAVWDDTHGPVVVVNSASSRAREVGGRRMVLAHEFCHLVNDRKAAARLKIMSGAWAPPVLERRANAFAAELLLPREGMLKHIGIPTALPDPKTLRHFMRTFKVGYIMCVEHVQNRFGLVRSESRAQMYRPGPLTLSPRRMEPPPAAASRGIKALLSSMPDVGVDTDFERPVDRGRVDESWDS